MAPSVFLDKASPPTDGDLIAVLGRSADRWREMRDRCGELFAPLTEDWSYPGKKYGWSLRLKRKKRSVVYLIPNAKSFLAATALGEKAAHAALAGDLPADVKTKITDADRYAEGRAFRHVVRVRADVDVVLRVLAYKMAT